MQTPALSAFTPIGAHQTDHGSHNFLTEGPLSMDLDSSSPSPEGIASLLDTDLYKLTMQCAVFKYFRDVPVSYAFTNRTPEKRLSRPAFNWLGEQIRKLGNISLSDEEYQFLQSRCSYLTPEYLEYLRDFRLRPSEEVSITFTPAVSNADPDLDIGDIDISIHGTWSSTILYEIPLLALISEAYFRFIDTDWNYDGQEDQAYQKGLQLLEAGCDTTEFGTRRRRDYHTQALVIRGLIRASKEAVARGFPGGLAGTSNVHLAMRFGLAPLGTVAHEWFMGTAAIIGDYKKATEEALRHWVSCFGSNLSIALTDTFGTPEFLKSFSLPVRPIAGGVAPDVFRKPDGTMKTYAEHFIGVRQDSGDPAEYTKTMRSYYDEQGIKDSKVIVFSDSLNIERCLEYKHISDKHGLQPRFGVGTFLSNDFVRLSTRTKSTPLNIVIKLNSAAGRPAVKISDTLGKNTGDRDVVERVKRELGYVERRWEDGDESSRWGKDESVGLSETQSPCRLTRWLRFRVLVLIGLVVISVAAAVGSVGMRANERFLVERRGHVRRQFQFAALLAAQDSPTTSTDEDAAVATAQSEGLSSSVLSSSQPMQTETMATSPNSTAQGDSVPEAQPSQTTSRALLDALTEALRGAISVSAKPESTTAMESSSSSLELPPSSASQTQPLSTEASATETLPPPEPEPSVDFSFGLLGGLTGSLQGRELSRRGASDEQVLSLLGPLSDVVAQAVVIDAGAAAQLTDIVLGALPIDASAVASTVPRVAEQASASTVDLLPFILPAVAAALGRELKAGVGAISGGLSEALRNVVSRGIMVINQIASNMKGSMSPEVQAILDEVAAIVYAAAKRLGQALCAISPDEDGSPLEAIIPCESATPSGAASVTPRLMTLNPESAVAAESASASWNIIPLASPQAYDSPPPPPPTTSSSPPTASSSCTTSTMMSAAQATDLPSGGPVTTMTTPGMPWTASGSADVKTAQPTSCPVVQPAPCPTCPTCEGSRTLHDSGPDATSGPCPGSGFPCSDCLNGWFCPPLQTPAQAAPCGLGWPCFHCKSGWFCISGNAPASTSQAPTTTTMSTTSPPTVRASGDTTGDWTYVGCFRDAIDRTLVGSKPLDYLRGEVSNEKCASHCASKGYAFAGTEAGIECWCGSAIRDDGVRLPDRFCEMPCPGTGGEACGGSWAISVYVCAAGGGVAAAAGEGASAAARPPPVPSPTRAKDYGPVAGLLLLAQGG
ncbi:hypothetical protein L249_7791 [Ophiocordyceps polyrhachis-furcata BCC 54312]|uniref:Nicotinate phosphoribosyltransferase n=1 Tax=Ophiocordyceps polyrhachis-furcata BCC 54312 TaxID=1330021 RepID=A0A367L0Q7_9HYPO|nr:hypothetical protein L249_7791 [Ophiocordyceps polyrhachis-furcata BCC 54312]